MICSERRLAGVAASLARREPETRSLQPTQQLSALHDDGACLDEIGPVLLGDVVVIALERSPRDSHPLGKVVQLVVRRIAHEVTPFAALEPPPSLVHQDRHGHILASPGTARQEVGSNARHTGGVTDRDDIHDTPPSELRLAWQRHIGHDDGLLDRLITRHRERQRRYHRIEHVESVVRHVVELCATEHVTDVDAVVAAAMYHDAIYEPQHPANERASARLARRDLARLGWSDERCAHVGTMIEGTATHLEPPSTDAAVLFDADLAILGADAGDYSSYVARVRDEYSHLDDTEWVEGRIAVMTAFVERDPIYATATGRERWEAAARRNITDELETLRR